ncbi:capsular polysaccharide export protein, LipB/KpsS family [Sphingopyxis panaciterrae]
MFDLLSDPWPVIERTAVLYSAEPATPFARLAALANRPIFRLDTDGEPLAIDQGTIIGDAINDLSTAWSYSSPYDGSAWTPLQMLDYLGLWRRRLDDTAGIGAVVGVGRWKRGRTREILIGSPDLIFAPNAEKAVRDARGSAIAAWPSRTDTAALGRNFPSENIWRLEDGFIRSAGLGAALVKPNSLVLDRRGIYYDPRTPSDLEHILQSVEFSDGLRERARLLIAQIRRNGATKYNLPGEMIDLPSNRHIILVAGQVSDDQSVLTAGAGTTVVDILAAVRAENPDSYLVYKAHPDVAARLRKGEWRGEAITAHADLVLAGGDIDALLARVDQVHVLSSLLGLEALLRGCNVVTHGQPFFAGWGLTEDRAPVARRTRRLSLEELVAATLIIYPLYVDPKSGLPCSIEHLLDRLADAKPPSRGRMLLARIIEPLRKCRIRAHRIPI